MKDSIKALIGVALAIASQAAIAGSTTWNFTNNAIGDISNSHVARGNSSTLVDSSSGISLNISSWSTTGFEGKLEKARLDNGGNGLLSYNRIENGSNNGNHAIDNKGGHTDLILFKFNKAVELSAVNLGWVDDSDISIAGFNVNPAFAGKKLQGLANQAVFKANYSDLGQGVSSLGNNTGAEYKYWVISAYNRIFSPGVHWSNTNDAFKLASLTTHSAQTAPSQVSAPGTIGMMLLGLALVAMRRLKK